MAKQMVYGEEARKALSEMNAEGDAESSGSDSETP